MSSVENPYQAPPFSFAAQAAAGERADFIAKTYGHLAGAILVFVALEALLLSLPGIDSLVGLMIGTRYGWLAVLGLFMVVSWIADSWARSAISMSTQYMGLGLYVLAEAVIFVPLLYIARAMDPMLIPTAGVTTLVLFGVLTAVVFATRADFSFLRSVLIFGGFAALALIVVAILFGFALGPIFTVAMIALACGYILYDTSNVLHHYRIGQHVAAALALFAAVALLFWYILRLFMGSRR
ncbi:MAG: Bax inhibitor-1 family protein [Planctomycetia bacterium]|nr:Bax inhibitor-1 family protein [Planctomycetia bacterium]